MSNGHVPAWKKLGLKLKYAKEETSAHDDTADVCVAGQKRKSSSVSNTTASVEPPVKKSRIEAGAQTENATLNVTTVSLPTRDVTPKTKPKAEPVRKKSVAFAADTKHDHDDSNQSILVSAVGSPGSTPKKPKKEKKPKNDRAAPRDSAPHERRSDTLQYLHDYTTSRESWKFNKNREVKILKHILSTDEIPNSYQASLASYIYGLKASGARQRLTKDCQEAIAKNAVSEHASELSRQDHEEFKARLLDDLKKDSLVDSTKHDQAYQDWIENEPRSTLLLTVLGQPVTAPKSQTPSAIGQMSTSNGASAQTPQTKVKKSKVRTSRIEMESDSDSSSSDSDTEVDSSSGTEAGEAEDETSSSGSSSSDSESDSESSSSSGSSDSEEESSFSASNDTQTEKPLTNGVHSESSSDSDSD